jgi:hypothetical protein
MAQESVIACPNDNPFDFRLITLEQIEHFAALVAAAEREACAQVVDHILKEGGGTYGDAIRARGETK